MTSNVLPAKIENVPLAVTALRAGQACAFPSDTLYGFAACASTATAVEGLYRIKGRPGHVPLAICVADVSDVATVADTALLPEDELLPGALTLVLPRLPGVLCPELNPGLDRIGIRVPDCDFLRAVARGYGRPLALTSANVSGQRSTIEVGEFEPLWSKCALVFDAGAVCSSRDGSTVVDLSQQGTFAIVRDGVCLQRVSEALERRGLVRRAA